MRKLQRRVVTTEGGRNDTSKRYEGGKNQSLEQYIEIEKLFFKIPQIDGL